jgi:hypothetical protein
MPRFASLTAGLLARKGEAAPAATPFAELLLARVGSRRVDIQGLTPMAYPGSAKVGATVKRPLYEVTLNDEERVDAHCGPCAGQVSDDPGKTFHVNLRLKRARFVKLKLSAALLRRPAQDIVSEALDLWFEGLPSDVIGDCACMKAPGD